MTSCVLTCLTHFFVLLLVVPLSQCARIAVVSCSNQREGRPAIWHELLKKDPEHLVLLGDNIYTDKKTPLGFIEATPAVIDEEYKKLSEETYWNKIVDKIGWNNIFATWDDHDYGINDGDKTYKHRNESMESFLNFFHFSESDIDRMMKRGGVYGSYNLNVPQPDSEPLNVKVVLMDTRYFKDREGTRHGDFLGEVQWQWLERELQDASADIVLLGSSIQALPSQKIVEESWSTFPESRARLLRLISDAVSPNVLLLSGDVHMAEVSQAVCFSSDATYYRHLWELSSSGMSHTFTTTLHSDHDDAHGSEEKNILSRGWLMNTLFNLYQATYPAKYRENRFKDQYKGLHFALVDIDVTKKTVNGGDIGSMTLQVVNYNGKVMIEKVIPILPRRHSLEDARQGKEGLVREPWVGHVVDRTVDSSVWREALRAVSGEVHAVGAANSLSHNCVPRWGVESYFQRVMFLLSIAIFLFIIIAIPLMGIIWLVFASVYYISIEQELRRREMIEARHDQLKKKKT